MGETKPSLIVLIARVVRSMARVSFLLLAALVTVSLSTGQWEATKDVAQPDAVVPFEIELAETHEKWTGNSYDDQKDSDNEDTSNSEAEDDTTPAPTDSPTDATPTPTPTPTPSADCEDYTTSNGSEWHDSGGDQYNCQWYSYNSSQTGDSYGDHHCESYGESYEYDGKTGDQACCTCGGGTNTTSSPTDAPTVGATDSPTDATPTPTPTPSTDCEDYTTSDGQDWHDSGGDQYTCEWYSYNSSQTGDSYGDHHCESYGDSYEYDGYTANEACCTCGGGNGDTDSPTEAPHAKETDTPTAAPTNETTLAPHPVPTFEPTITPTQFPTFDPSPGPTVIPTVNPTEGPTHLPTVTPTSSPTLHPTMGPSETPSANPTESPTDGPTEAPSPMPSTSPTREPTVMPTPSPTESPTCVPDDDEALTERFNDAGYYGNWTCADNSKYCNSTDTNVTLVMDEDCQTTCGNC